MPEDEDDPTELDALRRESERLAGDLSSEASIDTNAALLDLAPGDPKATTRLSIGLLNTGRAAEAVPVLQAGLLVHPGHTIMVDRLAQAKYAMAKGKPTSPIGGKASKGSSAAWDDLDVQDLVDRSLAGEGKEACLRFCAASLRASESLDHERTAVTPIKSGYRFRVIGGIFTGCGPWRHFLTVAVRKDAQSVIGAVTAAGGTVLDEAKAVPCVQLGVPRGEVAELHDLLLPAHVEHLRLSLEYGPPTHAHKHSEPLRQLLLQSG